MDDLATLSQDVDRALNNLSGPNDDLITSIGFPNYGAVDDIHRDPPIIGEPGPVTLLGYQGEPELPSPPPPPQDIPRIRPSFLSKHRTTILVTLAVFIGMGLGASLVLIIEKLRKKHKNKRT